MRRTLVILCMLSVVFSSMAQGNGFDMQLLSDADISGSSRYVGLGGAMAALGGDVSAVKDNPAALGVYRRSEVSMSLQLQPSRYITPSMQNAGFSTSVPELAWVFTFNKTGRQRGVLSNTIILSYQRIRSYNGEWQMSEGGRPYSQTDMMAGQASGLTQRDLSSVYAYDNENVGWLSKLGYDLDMIGTTTEGGTEWVSLEGGNVNNSLSISETGSLNQYSFGWGMNISNRLAIGLSSSVLSLSYAKNNVYKEVFESNNNYNLQSALNVSGIGINLHAGVIYRPVPRLRLAASLQSPTWSSIRYQSSGSGNSWVEGASNSSYSDYYTDEKAHHMPFRSVVGLAYTFGTKGLLSLEYDYQHGQYENMQDEHLLKMGGEVVLKNNCFIDLGYALKTYGKYAENEAVFWPSYTSARMDSDFRHGGIKHYASVGLSYRSRYFILGTAYQYAQQQLDFFAHAEQTEPVTCTARTHRIVFTLAWRYQR